MQRVTVADEISKYVRSEAMKLTLWGGLSTRRGPRIYKESAKRRRRESFNEKLRVLIDEWAMKYKEAFIDGKKHTANVTELAECITKDHSDILHGNRLRIGIAQKLLNLYLKYLWVFGQMEEWKTKLPPHCPFDNKIIGYLRKIDKMIPAKWTDISTEHEYEKLISAAKTACAQEKFNSIAEWELVKYNTL